MTCIVYAVDCGNIIAYIFAVSSLSRLLGAVLGILDPYYTLPHVRIDISMGGRIFHPRRPILSNLHRQTGRL